MSTLEKNTPYTPALTFQSITILLKVYIVNSSVSKRFDGMTKHFSFVTLASGVTDNNVLLCEDTLRVNISWQPLSGGFESDILQKESMLQKQDTMRRCIKSMFGDFIKTKMNIGYKEKFDTTQIKISTQGDYKTGTRYTILYKESPFAYLVQIPEAVQLEFFQEPS